jgi:hypothetical protein
VGLFEDDLATMFADTVLTVPVSIGASSTRGMFGWKDVFTHDPNGGFATTHSQVVTIVDGSLSGLVYNATIVIDGVNYRVRDIQHVSYRQVDVVVA